MKNLPVLMSLFIHFLFIVNHVTIVFSSAPPYIPVDSITLDCGSSTNQTAQDGREWIEDEHSKFAHIQEQITNTNASSAISQASSVTPVPYMTARIFRSPFTYSFPVTPGPKFVRLYFYPTKYPDFDSSKAYFDVTATAGDSFTLLKNFSADLVANSLNAESFMREFCINVVEPNQRLNLTFLPSSPSSSTNNSSYAFVNGIEIISMPTHLYYGAEEGMDLPSFVGQNVQFNIFNNLALETIWRMNIGGGDITAMKDTGMYRKWSQSMFLMNSAVVPRNVSKPLKYSKIRNYAAPDDVYRSAITMGNNTAENSLHNLTWRLPVDKGFNYLVRLHFCEFQEEITEVSDRRFSIYLNNQTAQTSFDVIQFSGGNGIPMYRDYVVYINNEDFIFVDLGPDETTYSKYADVILNGLEVFKISNNRNLAGPNPELVNNQAQPAASTTEKSKKKNATLFIALGSAMGFLVIIFFMVCCVVLWRLRKTKYYNDSYRRKSNRSTKASSLPEELCRRFSLSEIKGATNDFDEDLVVGRGGFGNVYQGFIDEESTVVAVKRLNPGSKQGAHEFVTEIEMLSQLRYVHLVSLIGYCVEDREMILVYQYVANGTLRDQLYGSDNDPLTWKQRLEICVGAARGLHYLHSGVKDTIIHRDVKTTNILLDENWVAKVSDFGLSKMCQSDAAVSTLVKGTFGYLDPEYARSQQLTDKSDVYSFGVVLFEVLCARKPLDTKLDEAQCNLAHWARKCITEGTVHSIIDPFLMGKIAPECFQRYVEVAESCVRDQRIQRPRMGDVMEKLEFALALQEQADAAKEGINPDGAYSYPEVSFRASDKNVPGYRVLGLRSETGLTSLDSDTTGLSSLGAETESRIGDMFSETIN
ncbi:Mitogen-activated protein kinase kinase kinase [Parasponia andersonii]|uniref:Mitogen-activated protein kinase kinase kinase n=1 Tax=Parasponia andersonii TaxID=3476 RepID=A0A2P5ASD1_PARAD|nr:Mitogen-activated protein kinase kinase kinase [Parasponia andersonii]